MSAPIELSADNFRSEIFETPGVVLVDFWASWCGPCRMIGPLVTRLAEELAGRVRVGKLDVDAFGALAAEYGVMSIPTLLLFKDGQEIERIVGMQPYETLRALVEAHL